MQRIAFLLSMAVPALIVTACSGSPSAPVMASSTAPSVAAPTTRTDTANGDVQYIDTKETARDLMDSVGESDAVVNCGPQAFIDVPVGGTFDCAMRSSTKSGTIVVTVGPNGSTSWALINSH